MTAVGSDSAVLLNVNRDDVLRVTRLQSIALR